MKKMLILFMAIMLVGTIYSNQAIIKSHGSSSSSGNVVASNNSNINVNPNSRSSESSEVYVNSSEDSEIIVNDKKVNGNTYHYKNDGKNNLNDDKIQEINNKTQEKIKQENERWKQWGNEFQKQFEYKWFFDYGYINNKYNQNKQKYEEKINNNVEVKNVSNNEIKDNKVKNENSVITKNKTNTGILNKIMTFLFN